MIRTQINVFSEDLGSELDVRKLLNTTMFKKKNYYHFFASNARMETAFIVPTNWKTNLKLVGRS